MHFVDERLPDRTMLDAVADQALDRIASLTRTVLGVPVALVSLVDKQRQVMPGQSGLPDVLDRSRSMPLPYSFCQHVVRDRQALIVADTRADVRLRASPSTTEYGMLGYAGIPLTDLEGRVVGSLCAIDSEPHPWTESEVSLLTDLAAACSAELQLRTAALRATKSRRDTEILLRLARTLSETEGIDDIAAVVSRSARDGFDALSAGLGIVDEDTQAVSFVELIVSARTGEYEQLAVTVRGHVPSRTVFAKGAPLYFETREQLQRDYPDAARALAEIGGEAYVCLPLTMNFRTIGTLGVAWGSARTFDDRDKALLDGIRQHTAQALHRARMLEERTHVAETLQAAVAPALPDLDGIRMAGCSLPSGSRNLIGGDWYDAFEGPNGLALVTIGDVQGHDIESAAVMGCVRSSLASLAMSLPERPAEIYRALDGVLATLRLDRSATGILAVIERGPDGVSLTWTNADHPAPVVLIDGQSAAYLESPIDAALGITAADRVRTTRTTVLPTGSTLLLYTNGLLSYGEFGGVGGDDGYPQADTLLASVERHRQLPPGELVDAVVGDWLDSTDHSDDAALLAVRID